jgi:hypothetical protein
MMPNESQEKNDNLVAALGVYGLWLLKNVRTLPSDDPLVQKLKIAYDTWHQEASGLASPEDHMPSTAMDLINCIDNVIEGLHLPNVDDTHASG